MSEEIETYKRYENKGCPCWCGKHCGNSCMTDGCDCNECGCFECVSDNVQSNFNE
jgi:hypothetical protein